ncbi:hypothetical protein LCGC14_2572720, partial [marine sediment metagenome]
LIQGEDGIFTSDAALPTYETDGILTHKVDNGTEGTSRIKTSHPGVTGSGARTMAAWLDYSGGGSETMMGHGTNASLQRWDWALESGDIAIRINAAFIVFDSNVSARVLHCATRYPEGGNITDLTGYVDGVSQPVGSEVAGVPNTTLGVNVVIGNRTSEVATFSNAIGEFRIYDIAVNPDIIRLMWEPPTRWDLYYELGRVFYSVPAVVAVGNPWHVYAPQ